MRLFVAVELPQAWLDALARLVDEMQSALSKDDATRGVRVRWARSEGIHLTLKFLGETPESRLDAVLSALGQAVMAPPGIEVRLGRVGSFGDRPAPRVVWAGVEGDTRALQALAARIDTWLGAAGFEKDRRGLTPHLTLARLPDGLSQSQREQLAALTGRFQPPPLPPFSVEYVSLIRSYLGPGGARYERVAAFPPLQP